MFGQVSFRAIRAYADYSNKNNNAAAGRDSGRYTYADLVCSDGPISPQRERIRWTSQRYINPPSRERFDLRECRFFLFEKLTFSEHRSADASKNRFVVESGRRWKLKTATLPRKSRVWFGIDSSTNAFKPRTSYTVSLRKSITENQYRSPRHVVFNNRTEERISEIIFKGTLFSRDYNPGARF